MYQAGLLLSGCGLYDGAETHEAVLAMLAVDRKGWKCRCLTIDRAQLHVVDHTTGNEKEGEERNVMEEAARLSRGRVDLLRPDLGEELDLLMVPGGYGCPKNLMTCFMEPGKPRELLPEVSQLLGHFLRERKPIGLISLADILLQPMVPDLEERLAGGLGAGDPVVIEDQRIVYTPGYRGHDRIGKVFAGIEGVVDTLEKFLEMGA